MTSSDTFSHQNNISHVCVCVLLQMKVKMTAVTKTMTKMSGTTDEAALVTEDPELEF